MTLAPPPLSSVPSPMPSPAARPPRAKAAPTRPSFITPDHPPRRFSDLLRDLGGISPDRVHLVPPPGTATLDDAILWNESKLRRGYVCELIDATLVEKAMSLKASILGSELIYEVVGFVRRGDLGIVSGEQGTMQIEPNVVRMPDVAFTSWPRVPARAVLEESAPLMSPDLAVEVLSPSNTRAEMARKRREFFAAGTRLIWMIDPESRTAEVYTGPEAFTPLTEADALDGGDVLPGFSLSLRDLFARMDALLARLDPPRT